MLVVVIVGSVVWLVSIVVAARWSDRVGRKPVYLVGSVLLVVWAFPFFLLLDTAVPALIVLSVVVLTIGLGLSYGPQAAFYRSRFELFSFVEIVLRLQHLVPRQLFRGRDIERLRQSFAAVIGGADRSSFAGRNQPGERLQSLVQRDVRVVDVREINVDVVCLEPS